MKRYFFSIRYVASDVDVELLAGRCISILHGFVTKYRLYDIGVSFPEWTDSFMGRSIAFVGPDEELLSLLREQAYFAGMSEAGFFAISDVRQVPEGVAEVRFIRNQRIAKCFPGEKRRRLARAKCRAEHRGEIFDPSSLSANIEVQSFHRARLDSSSNGQRFALHIQKQSEIGKKESGFNRYGLATNDEWKGTVPELSASSLKLEESIFLR